MKKILTSALALGAMTLIVGLWRWRFSRVKKQWQRSSYV